MRIYFKLLILFILFLTGCTKEEKTPIVNPEVPYMENISGDLVRFKVTDGYHWINSQELLTDKMEIIPNGTQFRITSKDQGICQKKIATNNKPLTSEKSSCESNGHEWHQIYISKDAQNWVEELVVESENGFFKFAVKATTVTGLQQVKVYPVLSDKINFQKNMRGTFFIEFLPGPIYAIGQISGERFKDQFPYNEIKDSNEPWVVIGNPSYGSYISIGPITDVYGNLINEGRADVSVEKGHISSTNPSSISSGYAFFSYTPVDYIGDFNVTVNVTGGENLISKTISFTSSSPILSFVNEGDFSNMQPGQEKTEILELKNTGAIPATYLSINVTSPFSIKTESNSCKEMGTLRSGESCFIHVFYRAGNSTLEGDGAVTVYSEPRGFVGSIASTFLRNNVVQPTSLKLSTTFVNFGSAPCGDTSSYEMYVQNSGDVSATNVQAINPPPFSGQTVPFVNITFPPKDQVIDPDLNKVINCGNEFLAKRKCRVNISFNPTSIVRDQSVVGQITTDNYSPLSLVISGYSVSGKPYGPFNLSILSPASVVNTGTMTIQPGNKAVMRASQIKDICGNTVKDGTIMSAMVTGGSLSSTQVVTNSGNADFDWNVTADSSLIGTHTITVNNGYGNFQSKNLEFTGIALKITGLVDWGQYLNFTGYYKSNNVELYTVTNDSPNMTATNLNILLSVPFTSDTVVVNFNCPSISDTTQVPCCKDVSLIGGLGPHKSCVYPISARNVTENIDYTSSIIVTSTDPGLNQASINTILRGRSPSIIEFNQNSYLFYSASAGQTLSQNIQITNQGPAISYNTQVIVEYPYTLVSNSCSQSLGTFTMPVGGMCQVKVEVPAGSSINEGEKLIQVINEAGVSNIRGQAYLAYAKIIFKNAEQFKLKDNCVGPLSIEIQGSQSLPVTSSINESISLNNSSLLSYYSNSSCTNSISTTKVPAGNSTSENFYVKTSQLGESVMKAVSSRFGNTEQKLNIRDVLSIPQTNNICPVYTTDKNMMFKINPSGGFGDYTVTFSDGSLSSGNFQIDQDEFGNKILNILSPLLAQTNVNIKVVDSKGNISFFHVPTYPRAEFSSVDGNLYYSLIPEGTTGADLQNYFASPFGVAPQRTYKPTLNTYGCDNTPTYQIARLSEFPIIYVNYGAVGRNSSLENAINSLLQSKGFTLSVDFALANGIYNAEYTTTNLNFSDAQMEILSTQLINLKDQYGIEPHGIKRNANFIPSSPSIYGSTVSASGVVTGGTGHGGIDRVEYLMVQIGANTSNTAIGKFVLFGSWPYGTSSDLHILSGETKVLTYGSFADYNNVKIDVGGKLLIENVNATQTSGNVLLTTIGIAGNLELNGTIEMGKMTATTNSNAAYAVNIPKTLNINTNPVTVTSTDTLTFNFAQVAGGNGGGGNVLNNAVGGNGGAGSGAGSTTTGIVQATATAGGKGGNSPSPTIAGGAGGTSTSLNGIDGATNSSSQGAGGGGGYKAFHGAPLAIKIKGKITGTGTIKATGYEGGSGGNGGNPGNASIGGYGGGGGAGGNGSPIWIFYKTDKIPQVNDVFVLNTASATKIKIQTSGGNGGLGGFGPSGRASSGAVGNSYNPVFTPF